MNSIITGYQTDVEMYYINSLHKITKGTIQGYCIDSAVFDSDGKLLKSTNERYQMKSFNGNVTYEYEFVKPEKIFKNLQDAIEFMCTDSLKLELDEIKNSKNNLHEEKTFNPIGSFDEYQQIAMSTKNYGKGLPVFYPTIKLNGEAGEVAEKVGKAWRDQDGVIDENYKIEIKKELGDTLWYICALADDLQINLADVANTNIVKILDRRKRNVTNGEGDNR